MCLDIPIVRDTILENTETFHATIITADDSVRLTIPETTVFILDDDTVTVGIQELEYLVVEGEGSVQVCVHLEEGSFEREISVQLQTSPGTALGEFTQKGSSHIVLVGTINKHSIKECIL